MHIFQNCKINFSITNPAFEPDVDSSSSSSSEPPPKPERNVPAVEPWAPAEPIKSTIISSTSESDQEITPQRADEAEAPKEVADAPAQEQVTQESDEETQAPPPKPGKIVAKRADNIFSDKWAYSNFYA
jgi:hypothetical protein